MNYTVVWVPAAERRLTTLWTEASDRQSVSNAADKIDELLGKWPLAVGESRSGDVRILLQKPLGVLYRVSENDRRVVVGHVWRYR